MTSNVVSKDCIQRLIKDVKDIITTDRNGLYKLRNKTIKKRFNKYFTKREDDGI